MTPKTQKLLMAADDIHFNFTDILLYCGFFSFLAGRYPALTAAASDMYLPFFVFP
jgi:hypothetical protein